MYINWNFAGKLAKKKQGNFQTVIQGHWRLCSMSRFWGSEGGMISHTKPLSRWDEISYIYYEDASQLQSTLHHPNWQESKVIHYFIHTQHFSQKLKQQLGFLKLFPGGIRSAFCFEKKLMDWWGERPRAFTSSTARASLAYLNRQSDEIPGGFLQMGVQCWTHTENKCCTKMIYFTILMYSNRRLGVPGSLFIFHLFVALQARRPPPPPSHHSAPTRNRPTIKVGRKTPLCPLCFSFHLSILYSIFLAHCSRRGPRFDLSSQQKFQQKMKIWCLGFPKMYKRKKIYRGTYTADVGVLGHFYTK